MNSFQFFLRCGAPSGLPKVRGLGPWPPGPLKTATDWRRENSGKETEKIEKYDELKERSGKIMESKSKSNPYCFMCPWSSNAKFEQLHQENWSQYTDKTDIFRNCQTSI